MANNQAYKEVKVQFDDNVQATISIVMINGDGEDPAEVYGTIFGQFGIGSQFQLFNRTSNSYVSVSPGQNIPLEMPLVNVPSTATAVQITANLFDYDTVSSDDEIANGNVVFPIGQSGQTSQGFIYGQYGNIRVDVLWG